MLEDRLGRELMKAGPAGKGTGGNGRITRMSYTLTSGSGIGRDCLTTLNSRSQDLEWVGNIPQSPADSINAVST